MESKCVWKARLSGRIVSFGRVDAASGQQLKTPRLIVLSKLTAPFYRLILTHAANFRAPLPSDLITSQSEPLYSIFNVIMARKHLLNTRYIISFESSALGDVEH